MRSPLLLKRLVVLAVACGAGGACRRDQVTSNVGDSAFVAVMAELKRVHEAVGVDSAERARRRKAVLEKSGLTPERLDTAARALARNPTRAQTVWQAIERRAADSTAGAK